MIGNAYDILAENFLVKKVGDALEEETRSPFRFNFERIVDMPRTIAGDICLVCYPKLPKHAVELFLRIFFI